MKRYKRQFIESNIEVTLCYDTTKRLFYICTSCGNTYFHNDFKGMAKVLNYMEVNCLHTDSNDPKEILAKVLEMPHKLDIHIDPVNFRKNAQL